ncbi:MAG: hypothetical protein A3F46_03700 [Legionellales bacterium RIFCSPHIGHO2_12_FULL_42_9]|nr:MAG: hypothetical protein A3F46_03700 [Legionellales bacterium RIFCSPHIGHO2_12_FULL_42_9]
MRYILTTALLLSITKLALAYDSTETAQIVCPSSITCDYDKGECDQPNGWFFLNYWEALEPLTVISEQSIKLSEIHGQLASLSSIYPAERIKKTSLSCRYRYGKFSAITLITHVKKLVGTNWVFSGFGKQMATCPDISDPTKCAGEK